MKRNEQPAQQHNGQAKKGRLNGHAIPPQARHYEPPLKIHGTLDDVLRAAVKDESKKPKE